MKKTKIYCLTFLLFSNYLSFSQQNDILNCAKFLWHKPVVTFYLKNLENQLNNLCKIDISDKLYLIHGLGSKIIDFKEQPLSKNDTATYEKYFIKLLKGVDTLKNINRIIALTEAVGDNGIFCDYVFIETKDNCFCNRNNCGRDTVVSIPCRTKSLSSFLNYLKSYTIPDEKYRQSLSSERWFRIYEITKDTIYANEFYTTNEFDKFFKSIGL